MNIILKTTKVDIKDSDLKVTILRGDDVQYVSLMILLLEAIEKKLIYKFFIAGDTISIIAPISSFSSISEDILVLANDR